MNKLRQIIREEVKNKLMEDNSVLNQSGLNKIIKSLDKLEKSYEDLFSQAADLRRLIDSFSPSSISIKSRLDSISSNISGNYLSVLRDARKYSPRDQIEGLVKNFKAENKLTPLDSMFKLIRSTGDAYTYSDSYHGLSSWSGRSGTKDYNNILNPIKSQFREAFNRGNPSPEGYSAAKKLSTMFLKKYGYYVGYRNLGQIDHITISKEKRNDHWYGDRNKK